MSSDAILHANPNTAEVLESALPVANNLLLLQSSQPIATIIPSKTEYIDIKPTEMYEKIPTEPAMTRIKPDNSNPKIENVEIQKDSPKNEEIANFESVEVVKEPQPEFVPVEPNKTTRPNPFKEYLKSISSFWDKTENQTKVLSLAVLVLLVLPAIVMPNLNSHEEKVLGVTDSIIEREKLDSLPVKKTDAFNIGNPFENAKLPSVELPNISLPQYDIKPKLPQINLNEPVNNIIKTGTDTFLSMPKVELTPNGTIKQDTIAGKIRLDDTLAKNDAITDKYEIGDKLKVTYNGTTVDVVVTAKRVLPIETLIIVDRFKYAELTKDEKTIVVDGKISK